MKNFTEWLKFQTGLTSEDIFFVIINKESELSLFFPFKNKILFYKAKKTFARKIKEKKLDIFFRKNNSNFTIFISFEKSFFVFEEIFFLLKNTRNLRILFFFIKKKIKKKIFPNQTVFFSSRIQLFLEFFSKIKTQKPFFLKKKNFNKLNIIKIIKRKKLPFILILKWDNLFRFFFLKKNKNFGKLIKFKIFSKIINRLSFDFYSLKKFDLSLFFFWKNFFQRILEESGFLTIKITKISLNEIIFILNYI
ncbi:hypothetical protein HAN_2g354 (nucleomorph) [Hemiselmis andersenii]|uniref:Uncharacterized protein n=2 Tax=Hemiselmis andersenii TaxID=464988 RepID=A9BKJ9_HEMAN|nr:hypothetical protein HAN_2g354 [Hemiselmis andersenii]ABW98170.1 hypothetical protein HAN_2g354 [Hemiselmis andersenii]